VNVLQDKKYDTEIGVKSTAQRFDAQPRLWMTGFASVMSCGLVTTGWLCQQAWPYYLGVSLFAAHLGHQVHSLHVTRVQTPGHVPKKRVGFTGKPIQKTSPKLKQIFVCCSTDNEMFYYCEIFETLNL